MHAIVIARYTESLDWVLDVPRDFAVTIYNKGPRIEQPDVLRRATVVDRPNAGRESETYLWHMLNHGEAGDGFTVFTQGDPIEHSPDFLPALRNWRRWDDLQCLSWQWRADKGIPPGPLLAAYQERLAGTLRIRPERYSLTTWGPLDFFDAGCFGLARDYHLIHGLPPGCNIAAHFFGLCGMVALAEQASRHAVGVFSYGAIYAVRNSLIRALPRRHAGMLHHASLNHPVYGYVLERAWHHVFGAPFEYPLAQPRLLEDVAGLDDCFAANAPTPRIAA